MTGLVPRHSDGPVVIFRSVARNPDDAPFARLTPREREVLSLMAEGRSHAAIARRLVVDEGAVGKHVATNFAT